MDMEQGIQEVVLTLEKSYPSAQGLISTVAKF